MKNYNRLLSLLLAIVIAVGCVFPDAGSFRVYAAEAEPGDNSGISDQKENGEEGNAEAPAPLEMSQPVRVSDSWMQVAEYTFTVSGGTEPYTVTVTDEKENTAEVPCDEGVYRLSVSQMGKYTLCVADASGSQLKEKITEEMLDTTAPVVTQIVERVNDNSTKIMITALDLGGAQVTKVTFQTAGGEETEAVNSAASVWEHPTQANQDYTIRVYDTAGNIRQLVLPGSEDDTTAPQIQMVKRNLDGWRSEEVSYTVYVVDTQNAIASATFGIDEAVPEAMMEVGPGQYSFTAQQNCKVNIVVSDDKGNEATYTLEETMIDLTDPVVSEPVRKTDTWEKEAQYTVAAGDEESGIASITVTDTTGAVCGSAEAGEDGSYLITVAKSGTILVTVTSTSGRSITKTITDNMVDTTGPVFATPSRDAAGWAISATYTFTVEEPQSGLKSVMLTVGDSEAVVLTPSKPELPEGTTENLTEDEIRQLLETLPDIYTFTLTENVAYELTATDEVGNESILEGEEKFIDKVPPVIHEPLRAIDTWATATSYTFTAEDEHCGIKQVTVRFGEDTPTVLTVDQATGAYSFPVNANGTYTITVTDLLENTSNYEVSETQIDTVKPEITDLTRQESDWQKKATYTFKAADPQSGVAAVTVKIGESEPVTLTESEGVYSFTVEGNDTFEIEVIDTVGNKASLTADESKVDRTGPKIEELTRQETGWAQSATYTFTVTDNQSGPAVVVVTIGETVMDLFPKDGVYQFTAYQNGDIQIEATDKVGNKSTLTHKETQLDPDGPAIQEPQRQESGWTASATYAVEITDATSIQKVTISINGGEPTELMAQGGYYYFTVSDNVPYKIVAFDLVGNRSFFEGEESQIDKKGPAITTPIRSTTGWATSADYSFQAADPESQIKIVVLQYESEEPKTLKADADGNYNFTAEKNGKYTIAATDTLGNVSIVSVTEEKLDRIAPYITKLTAAVSDQFQSHDFTLEVSDLDSGVQSITLTDIAASQVTELTATEGVYTFTLKDGIQMLLTITDAAGNVTTQTVYAETEDLTAPVISNLSRLEGSWSAVGTYQFQVVDTQSAISSVTVTMAGTTQTLTPDANGIYSFTVTDNCTFILEATDAEGNKSSYSGAETKIDTANPEVSTPIRTTSGWASQAVYTFQATDTQSYIDTVIVTDPAGNEQELVADGTNTYTFTAKIRGTHSITVTDGSGKVTTVTVNEDKVDTDAPVIGQVNREEADWAATAHYSFTVTDDVSGVEHVYVTIGSGAAAEIYPTDGIYAFTMSANTTYTVTVYDAAGNTSEISGTERQIDQIKPAVGTLIRLESGWVKEAIYEITASDEQAGLATVTLTLGNDAPLLLQRENGKYTFTVPKNTVFVITVKDAVGNITTVNAEEKLVDNTAPVISAIDRENNGWTAGSKYLFTVDEDGSGIQSVTISLNGGTPVELTEVDGYYSFSLTENTQYVITATDKLGNVSTFVGTEYQVDTEGPQITEVTRGIPNWSASAIYTFRVADAASGIKEVTVTIGSGEPKVLTADGQGMYSFVMTENSTFTITAVDNVGNRTTHEETENLIDNQIPEVLLLERQEDGWTQAATYTFKAVDQLSSVASVTVTKGTEAPTSLTALDGTYSFVATANCDYIITVTDLVGNSCTVTVSEDKIDREAPAISNLSRNDSDKWTIGTSYAITVEDSMSGVKSVVVTDPSGANKTLDEIIENEYMLPVSVNGVYTITVTDKVGNVKTQTFTEDKIDTSAPVITALTRQQTGWQNKVTYTFRVNEGQSGIFGVSVVIDGGAPIILNPVNEVYYLTLESNCSFVISATDNLYQTATLEGEETLVDIQAPVISNLTREQDSWTTAAKYTFKVTDDASGTAKVTVQIGQDDPFELTGENGMYTFSIMENETFIITATDSVGNFSQVEETEDNVDTTAPIISELKRKEEGWLASADYTFKVSDDQSGVASVAYRINDGALVELTEKKDLYSFTLTENGVVTIVVTDAVGNQHFEVFEETQIDVIQPQVQELSRDVQGWTDKAVYSFRILEDQAGIKSVSVKIGKGEAQRLVADNGIYRFQVSKNAKFVITVTDEVGNVATVEGEETRIDTTPAVIGAPVREGDSWLYNAKYTFTVTEDQSGIASVTIKPKNGDAIELAADENGLYTYIAAENTSYTITVLDTVGNKATASFKEEKVDSAPPEITNVKRKPNNWAQESIYTFTVKDILSGIQTVSVTLDEKKVELTDNGNGTYTFNAAANGTYQITSTDIVGNTQSVTVGESLIDLKAPVIKAIEPQMTWNAETNAVKFTVTDNGAILAVVINGNGYEAYQARETGKNLYEAELNANGTYTVTAIDEAGNSTTEQFVIWHIDTEKPAAPFLTTTATGWTNQAVTITAASSDAQSGVASYWYSSDSSVFDANTWTKMDLNGGKGVSIFTEEQNCDYHIVAVDGVGRISDESTIHVSIDKTAPVNLMVSFMTDRTSGFYRLNAAGMSIYKDMVKFHALASDGFSGMAAYEYRIQQASGSTEWIRVAAEPNGVYPLVEGLTDGNYMIFVRAVDIAGNITEEKQMLTANGNAQFILENTPVDDETRAEAPLVTMATQSGPYNGEWTNRKVTMTVSGSDAVSGIHHYEVRIDYADPTKDDVPWQTVQMYGGNHQVVAELDTNATYYFRAVTYADNYSLETSRTVKIQRSAPVVGSLIPDTATGTNGWYTKAPTYQVALPTQNEFGAPVTYSLRYTFNNGAIQEVPYSKESTVVPLNRDGIWNVRLVSTDITGNTALGPVCEFRIDTKVPTDLSVVLDGKNILTSEGTFKSQWDDVNICNMTVRSSTELYFNKTVSLTLAADGGTSGLSAIFYQFLPSFEKFDPNAGGWNLISGNTVTVSPDGLYNLFFKAVDNAGNISFFSAKTLLMDSTAPTGFNNDAISLVPDTSNQSRYGFYNSDVTVNVEVYDPAAGMGDAFSGITYIGYRVLADGKETQAGQLYPGTGTSTMAGDKMSGWTGSVVIDAALNNYDNVVLEVTAKDKAGNVKVSRTNDSAIRIDMTAPQIQGSYDRNDPSSTFNKIATFVGQRTVTIVCTEKNFIDSESFVNVVDVDTGNASLVKWESNGDVHTATVPIVRDGNYTVSAAITDAAGNFNQTILFAEGTVAAQQFIIDNTSPSIVVTHTDNGFTNQKYFNTSRNVTITVTEKNFDPGKIRASIRFTAEDGSSKYLSVGKWTSMGITHTAQVEFSENGVYTMQVTGTDAVGNNAAATMYIGQAAQEWVVDTTIEAPTIQHIAEGSSYSGTLIPEVIAVDKNFENLTLRLYFTNNEETYRDVSSLMLTDETMTKESLTNGVKVNLNIFPNVQEYDGIYTLVATMTDLAGNRAESKLNFTVNRFGSIYFYDDSVLSILGKSMKKLDHDLVITEYNPSGIVDGSAQVHITCDGMPVTEPIFQVTEIEKENGWFEYQYVVSKDNFRADGSYEVVISTKDGAGNLPENTGDTNALLFSIDNAAPELPSIIGMELPINKAENLEVKLVVMDNVSLDSIFVYINNVEAARWEDLDGYSAERVFSIPEGMDQHVRIVVTDDAGNTLDTDSDFFLPGYDFNRDITVSSSMLMRFYANKPLFYGAFAVLGLFLLGLIIYLILLLRRDNEDDETPPDAPLPEPDSEREPDALEMADAFLAAEAATAAVGTVAEETDTLSEPAEISTDANAMEPGTAETATEDAEADENKIVTEDDDFGCAEQGEPAGLTE